MTPARPGTLIDLALFCGLAWIALTRAIDFVHNGGALQFALANLALLSLWVVFHDRMSQPE